MSSENGGGKPILCDELEPGDIAIMAITSDNPDIIALFPLVDIYPNVTALYITDNAWNGTHLAKTEATIEVRLHDMCVYIYGECDLYSYSLCLYNARGRRRCRPSLIHPLFLPSKD